MTTDRAALVARIENHLGSRHSNAMDGHLAAMFLLRDVLSLLTAEPARPQDTLRDAFKAGFSVAQHETDKYGEYHGESVEDEYRAWAAMGVEPTAEEK
jgi:hypothetical protein